MRLPLLIASVVAAGLTAFSAAAQEEGQYSAALSRMLSETAAGSCPADVMGKGLLAACNQQIAQMAPGLASLGAVESLTFVRAAEEAPHGRIEVYTVKFTGGHAMTWVIGGEQDGKFEVAYSQG